jgi:hypothetical protein
MYRLSVESTALDAIASRIGLEYANKVKFEASREYSKVFVRALVEGTPVKGPGRTGNMARSWTVKPEGNEGGIRITNTANYSKAVNDGSKAHWIPKTGIPGRDRKVLRWRTGGRGAISSASAVARHTSGKAGALAGKNFFFVSKRVWHPGTKGLKIVEKAFEKTADELNQLVHEGAERVIQELIATSI